MATSVKSVEGPIVRARPRGATDTEVYRLTYSEIVPTVGPFRVAAGVSDENSRGKLQNVLANSTAGHQKHVPLAISLNHRLWAVLDRIGLLAFQLDDRVLVVALPRADERPPVVLLLVASAPLALSWCGLGLDLLPRLVRAVEFAGNVATLRVAHRAKRAAVVHLAQRLDQRGHVE